MEALPAPGVAVFPHLIANSTSTQSITMTGETFNSNWNVIDGSGQTILRVDAEKMSFSHRKHVLDGASGEELCEIRKDGFGSTYNGVAPKGTALFETESHFHFGGRETIVNFVNNAAGGQQDSISFKNTSFGVGGEVTYKGKLVATVDRKMSMKGHYDLVVAQGLDPFLIVALTVVLADRAKSKSRGAAAGGAGGGGGC